MPQQHAKPTFTRRKTAQMKHTLIFLITIIAFASCSEDNTPGNLEPRLSASSATDITRTEATLQGNITLQGNTDMPKLRFVYSSDGGSVKTTVETFADDGRVSSRITGLTPGTQYSFYLQADNGRTTVNSNTMTFATVPNDKPTVSQLTVLSHGPASAIVSYAITDDGGEEITQTGCYITRTSDGETYKAVATAPGYDGTYKMRIGGLQQNTTYELKAFATNKEGETTGEALPFTTGNAVTLTEPGELQSLMGDDIFAYTSLSFAGPMNGDDLACLRRMAGIDTDGNATQGQLTRIDMADVSIVAGGGSYGEARYTEDNVIGYGLFAGCSKLESIVLPDNATIIERDALRDCASLTSITIPASVEQVTQSSGCSALAEILVSPANSHYLSSGGVLFNADATALIWFPMGKEGNYTLPSTVATIDDYAFRDCNITGLTLPDGLTDIGQSAFYGCKMKEIHMPDNLRQIPVGAFQGCPQLSTVYLGTGTELVSDYAFDGCPLLHIYLPATYPPVCRPDAFGSSSDEIFSTCVLHVPSSRLAMYKQDSRWGQFKNIIGI